MKIGIFTFHCAANYGAVLQTYCLQEVLKDMGHEVYVIDYRPKYLIEPYKTFAYSPNIYNSNLEKCKGFVRACLVAPIRWKRNKNFSKFIHARLNLYHLDLNDESNDFDAFVFGSDQIWSPKIASGFDKVYLGDFPAAKGKKLIAYAASAGSISNFLGKDINYFLSRLQFFNKVTVREKSLAEYINQKSLTTSEVVFDPVLLAGPTILHQLLNTKKVKEQSQKQPYLLLFQIIRNDDGRHVGNYYLCEQIKIDGDRVNIQDCYEDVLEENPNPTVADCGYLLEFDDNYDEVNKFHTGRGLPCMFKDIVSDELFDAVKARIEGIEANLEAGNYDAAYNDLDIHSVIDYFFIQELAFNDEYKHPKSVYMYIDGLGKLTAGPVWDFDWQTFVNYDNVEAMINKYGCDTYRCRKGDEWLYGASKLAEKPTWPWQDYDYENDKPYMWYPLLFKDANFRQAVQERWTIIYPALLTVESKIEELADQNRLSDTFNSVMWPQIQVKSSGTAAFNGDEEMTFDEAVASMKQAYRERLNWMNTNIMNGSFVIDAE